jgi:ribonuclease HII
MNRNRRDKLIAGVDEAGRGSVIGPLVVAGIGIKESKLRLVRSLNLRDSKTLTRTSRRRLFSKIVGIADYICLCVLSTSEIDESVRLKGLNKLEAEAMAAVISDIQPDNVYVDCCDVKPLRYTSLLETHITSGRVYQLYSFHHADALNAVVSAASIIAKVIRDTEIYKIRKTHSNIGSGYPSDKLTINFIKDWVLRFGEAPVFVRKSWRPVKLILKESAGISQDQLDQFCT